MVLGGIMATNKHTADGKIPENGLSFLGQGVGHSQGIGNGQPWPEPDARWDKEIEI